MLFTESVVAEVLRALTPVVTAGVLAIGLRRIGGHGLAEGFAIGAVGVVTGLILGKAFYLIEFGWARTLSDFVSNGASLFGLVLGIALGFLLLRLLIPIPVFEVLDGSTPALGAGVFLLKLSCFFKGCCGGQVCQLPWSVEFSSSSAIFRQQIEAGLIEVGASSSLPTHPVQVYEALFGLLSALLTWWMLPRREFAGQVFLHWVSWYAVFRFFGEFLRADKGGWHPLGLLSFSQVAALIVVILVPIGNWLAKRAYDRSQV